jgi:hypothetical protein
VIDRFRTWSALVFTRHRIGPRIPQIRAWAWLAAETDDLEEKTKCLEAIVALDPDLEWAHEALRLFRNERVRAN